MFPIVIVGTRGALTLLAIYVVGYPITKVLLARSSWYQKAAQDLKSKGTASVGGFTFSSGSSSSGFSSDGGSFSGGGGSSGAGAVPAAGSYSLARTAKWRPPSRDQASGSVPSSR